MRCGNKRNERKKKGNRDRKEIEFVLKRKKKKFRQISERVWWRYRSREERENQRLK